MLSTGQLWDFHPIERALTGRTKKVDKFPVETCQLILCLCNNLDAHYLKLFFAVLMEEIKSFLISTHCSRILLSS